MKTRGVTVAVVCLAFAGCSSSGSSTPSPGSPEAEDAYYTVIHAVVPDLSRENVLKVGHAVCDGLDASPTLASYAKLIQAAGKSTDVLKGKVMVDGAVGAFCPTHDDLRKKFAEGL